MVAVSFASGLSPSVAVPLKQSLCRVPQFAFVKQKDGPSSFIAPALQHLWPMDDILIDFFL